MAGLPAQYSWLAQESAPEILMQAIKLLGTVEAPGKADNAAIIEWSKEVEASGRIVKGQYAHDEIPWCGLFMAVCAARARYLPPPSPLWALSWAKFGTPVPDNVPMLGDVLVFSRDGGGHVALYVGEDKDCYHILGGNQRDSVCILRKPKDQVKFVRRCQWRYGIPPNVRRVHLAASGGISQNEA